MNPECEVVGEMLSGWVDGDLAERERWRVTLHLGTCPACARAAAELAATVRALHRLGPLHGPAGLRS